MDEKRYHELVKITKQMIQPLTSGYQDIAKSFIKRARGYGAHSIDNELKIQETIRELQRLSEARASVNIVIPSRTEFIDSNISKLSKKVHSSETTKSVFAVTILLLVVAVWVFFDLRFKKTPQLAMPSNLQIIELTEGEIQVTWDPVINANNGYCIYYASSSEVYSKKEISENKAVLKMPEKSDTYTIYVYAREITYSTEIRTLYAQSDSATIQYKK